ncbi:MAG: proline dehydrogenase [Deltaproteobacteria bacterium]|nr:proline dehydrogenase [Deltaproteobacteria bacterium]HCH66507.1 proline dehydrogenase [Deltaproteobacteria bacterium]
MPEVSFDNTRVAFAGKDDADLLKSAWLFRIMSNSTIVDIGSHITQMALQIGLPVQTILKSTIYEHFCGGESLEETEPMVANLARQGVSTILDYGVEAKESQDEFDANLTEQVRAIEFADAHDAVPYVSCKITGYASFALLEKLETDVRRTDAEEAELGGLRRRMHAICQAAVERDVCLYVDAEESWIQDAIDDIATKLMARYNQEKPTVFNTVQLYRHDRLAFLKAAHQHARTHDYILGVKLVRGAYMEKERERAERLGYRSPIHIDKASVDRDFDAAVAYCLAHIDEIAFCAATHNEHSCGVLVKAARDAGVPLDHPHIHFAQLYGMSDHISFNLARAGCNASKYVPYGPVRDVVPYLIRRAQENRSVSGQVGRELRLILDEIERRKGARSANR